MDKNKSKIVYARGSNGLELRCSNCYNRVYFSGLEYISKDILENANVNLDDLNCPNCDAKNPAKILADNIAKEIDQEILKELLEFDENE